MTEWQDISTAPRDGTRVLAFSGGLVHMAKWTPRFAEVYGDTSEGWYSYLLDRRIEPTLWAHVPEPPDHKD